MSKRRHNFGTKRFKEKSLFIFHARIALKSLILLFVHLIARGARIGKTHTHTHTHTDRQTDRQDKYCNPRACAPRVNYTYVPYEWAYGWYGYTYPYECGHCIPPLYPCVVNITTPLCVCMCISVCVCVAVVVCLQYSN